MDSLLKLPEGAVYHKKSDRATSIVYRKGRTIIVESSCDSLQQMVYNLEEKMSRTSSEVKKEQTVRAPESAPIKTKLEWYLYGVITGILLTLIIKLIRKYGTHIR